MDGARTLHMAQQSLRRGGLRRRPTRQGGKVLLFAASCQSVTVSSIDKSLSGTVQRLSVQVCMSAAILAATHTPPSWPALWPRAGLLTSAGRAERLSYSKITSVRRATLSTLGRIVPKTSNWPAPPLVDPFPTEGQRADHHRCSSVPVPSLCLFRGRWTGLLRCGDGARWIERQCPGGVADKHVTVCLLDLGPTAAMRH